MVKHGFVFGPENKEGDTLFLGYMSKSFIRDLKSKKNMVPVDPDGGAWWAHLAPRLDHNLEGDTIINPLYTDTNCN
jgi:hypothetical protein